MRQKDQRHGAQAALAGAGDQSPQLLHGVGSPQTGHVREHPQPDVQGPAGTDRPALMAQAAAVGALEHAL